MQIGPYVIAQIVERDQSTVVCLARHSSTGRLALLTIITPGQTRPIEDWIAWLNIVKELHHPNILTFSEGGRTADGGLYVAGPHLPVVLTKKTILTPNQALILSYQVSAALDYAHKKGIFHGPLRPWHVVKLPDGQYAVRGFERGGDFWSEQRVGDIAALAQFLYRALTGRNAAGDNVETELPQVLVVVVNRALSASTQETFPSAGAFHMALLGAIATLPEAQRNHVLSDPSVRKSPKQPLQKNRQPFWVTMSLIVLVGFVATVIVASFHNGSSGILATAKGLIPTGRNNGLPSAVAPDTARPVIGAAISVTTGAPTFTPTRTPSPTATMTYTFTATASMTNTATFTSTPSATATATATPTPSATITYTFTATPSMTNTATFTSTPSATATATATPSPSATMTYTFTATPSVTPEPTALRIQTF